MFLYDLSTHPESEPRARTGFGTHEGLKDAGAEFRRYTRAGIADGNAHTTPQSIRKFPGASHADAQRAALAHRVERIADDIREDLAQFPGKPNHRPHVAKVFLDSDIRRGKTRLKQR